MIYENIMDKLYHIFINPLGKPRDTASYISASIIFIYFSGEWMNKIFENVSADEILASIIGTVIILAGYLLVTFFLNFLVTRFFGILFYDTIMSDYRELSEAANKTYFIVKKYILTFIYTTLGILFIIIAAGGKSCSEYEGWHCAEYEYYDDENYNPPEDITSLVDRVINNIFFLYCYFIAYLYTSLAHLRIHKIEKH
tara:strand:- start:3384 stop:3977 length:594 start_codon:yes stop_codon:yes gene_type:complete